uniref:Transcription factor CBF/NF-Y/archaeal histone domain-containing protein n=1 Tax=Brassica campestris TaxID=3711 RepID=M4F111_BRACM
MEMILPSHTEQRRKAKSLELFFQELCDRTYEITLEKGAKTVSSLHLKHCVETYDVFDFMSEVVSKVPDYGQAKGQGQGNATMYDRSISKKRCEMQKVGNAKPSGRGSRGRGLGRGRGGRVARTAERENLNRQMELETAMVEPPPPQDSIQVDVSVSSQQDNEKKDVDGGIAEPNEDTKQQFESPKECIAASNEDTKQQLQSPKEGIDIDLNAESHDLNETKLAPLADTDTASEEYPGWPINGQNRSSTLCKFR